MIIDEAGMAHTRLSARLFEQAIDAHVKVVAIGDSGQLSSVQAGGWLGALSRQLGSHELREVMRQRDPQERRGLARVYRGRPDSYLLSKTQRGHLKDRGELGESVLIAGHEWAVGDRVIARRNDRGRDLDNGTRGTITHVDERNGVTIQADTGGERQLDLDYTTHYLEHAYALTGHGMQGGTVQRAAVVGRRAASRATGPTPRSPARENPRRSC
ncbi:MAG: AAA family ATPase [Solirubrobacteraceae bacterium]